MEHPLHLDGCTVCLRWQRLDGVDDVLYAAAHQLDVRFLVLLEADVSGVGNEQVDVKFDEVLLYVLDELRVY
jgi:hypothetical protein